MSTAAIAAVARVILLEITTSHPDHSPEVHRAVAAHAARRAIEIAEEVLRMSPDDPVRRLIIGGW